MKCLKLAPKLPPPSATERTSMGTGISLGSLKHLPRAIATSCRRVKRPAVHVWVLRAYSTKTDELLWERELIPYLSNPIPRAANDVEIYVDCDLVARKRLEDRG